MKNQLKLPEKARSKLTALTISADEAMTLSLAATRRLKGIRFNDALLTTSDPAKFAAIEEQIAQQRGVQSDHKQRHRESADLVIGDSRHWLSAQPDHVDVRGG